MNEVELAIAHFKDCIQKDAIINEDFTLHNIEVILDYITKPQKENETKIKGFENEELICSKFTEKVGKNIIDYKFEYENNQKIINELQKEMNKLINDVRTYNGQFKRQEKEIRKLQKQIDLMAEQLSTDIHSKEWVKKYYKDLAAKMERRIV